MSPQVAIIFDMDGLMVDTEPLSRQAWQQVLQPFGHTLDDELYGRMIGRRSDESTQMVLDTFALPLAAEELSARKASVFVQLRAKGVPVMPGLMALHEVIAQRALPWGVATSSPRRHASDILAQLGLSGQCGAVVGGDEVARGKPAPDIYLLAAERLGVPPAHCLALEDSVPGSQAAVAAGMTTVAIPGGHTTAADFGHVHYISASLYDVAKNLDALVAAVQKRC